MIKYQFTDDMGQISGFGGGYEATCRAMVVAGLEWFDQHPDADPKFTGWKETFGLILEDNADAQALSAAMVKPAKGEATGAMHHVCVGTVLWIRKHGWDKYVEQMKGGGQ